MAYQSTHTCQLLGTIYGLNKSFTKKMIVGLELDDSSDTEFKPTIRLLSNNFNGVSFFENEWLALKNMFQDMDRYFRGTGDDLRDQKVYGPSWSLKFCTAHSDKAIEIEDERRPENGVPVKRFRQSIIMKRVTFDNIQEYIASCLDVRMSLLKKIAPSISTIVSAMVDNIYKKAVESQEGQIQVLTSRDVKNIVNDQQSDEIIKAVIVSVKKLDRNISESDITILFFELLSVHMSKIVDLINSKIQ